MGSHGVEELSGLPKIMLCGKGTILFSLALHVTGFAVVFVLNGRIFGHRNHRKSRKITENHEPVLSLTTMETWQPLVKAH